jgi:tetratricopeptide (TPR) repeat protein
LLITFLLSLLTISRNITWGNEISLWKDCIAKTGTKARAYRILADALQKEKRWNEAILNYKRSLEIEPSSPLTLNNLAGVYEALGFLDKAMDLYGEAYKRSPEYSDALNNMGYIAMKKKNMDEAIRFLSLAASKKVSPVCYYNLGTAYLETKKLDDALIWMKKARDLNEDFAPVHANLGMIYYLKNYSEAAIAELKRALEINPDHVEAHANLGIIYHIDMKLKDDRIALRHLRKALELAPNFSNAEILRNIIKEIEKQ